MHGTSRERDVCTCMYACMHACMYEVLKGHEIDFGLCDDAGATETKHIHAFWKWCPLLSRQWAGQAWTSCPSPSSHTLLQVSPS